MCGRKSEYSHKFPASATDFPQAAIDRILNRVREAHWPDRLEASDWRYGANWDYMKALARYWTTQFDWRKAEMNLNRYPQFLARVGEFDIHFYHVKGRGPRPIPLILTHGWSGSVFEFIEAIGPLTTALLWNKLMTEVLGYVKYGAQGGDLGNAILTQLGRAYPNSLIGL